MITNFGGPYDFSHNYRGPRSPLIAQGGSWLVHDYRGLDTFKDPTSCRDRGHPLLLSCNTENSNDLFGTQSLQVLELLKTTIKNNNKKRLDDEYTVTLKQKNANLS